MDCKWWISNIINIIILTIVNVARAKINLFYLNSNIIPNIFWFEGSNNGGTI
jgi:hypothetical protein